MIGDSAGRQGDVAKKTTENLIPFDEMDTEKHRKLSAKGGEASGEARRRKRTMKQYADLLLSQPIKDERILDTFAEVGIEGEQADNKMLMVYALMKAAHAGDVAAEKELRSIIGEDNNENMRRLHNRKQAEYNKQRLEIERMRAERELEKENNITGESAEEVVHIFIPENNR